MSNKSRIPAAVSAATKERFDRFTRSAGLKKTFVVAWRLAESCQTKRSFQSGLCSTTRCSTESLTCSRARLIPPQPFVS